MEHIIHLPEFQIIVCKECQYAVLPSEIDSHFTPAHPHGFTKQAREEIIARISKIGGLIMDKDELEQCEFPFPADTAEPIVGLVPFKKNGLRCTLEEGRCLYISSCTRNMRKHCYYKSRYKA